MIVRLHHARAFDRGLWWFRFTAWLAFLPDRISSRREMLRRLREAQR